MTAVWHEVTRTSVSVPARSFCSLTATCWRLHRQNNNNRQMSSWSSTCMLERRNLPGQYCHWTDIQRWQEDCSDWGVLMFPPSPWVIMLSLPWWRYPPCPPPSTCPLRKAMVTSLLLQDHTSPPPPPPPTQVFQSKYPQVRLIAKLWWNWKYSKNFKLLKV